MKYHKDKNGIPYLAAKLFPPKNQPDSQFLQCRVKIQKQLYTISVHREHLVVYVKPFKKFEEMNLGI